MQTKIRIIKPLTILVLTSIIAFTSQAQQKNENGTLMQVSLDQPDSAKLKFKLSVSNPENKKVNITVSERRTGILHSQSFTSNTYTSRYDMSQLEDGEYIIEVANDKERVTKDISIQTIVAVNRIAYLQKTNKKEKIKPLAF